MGAVGLAPPPSSTIDCLAARAALAPTTRLARGSESLDVDLFVKAVKAMALNVLEFAALQGSPTIDRAIGGLGVQGSSVRCPPNILLPDGWRDGEGGAQRAQVSSHSGYQLYQEAGEYADLSGRLLIGTRVPRRSRLVADECHTIREPILSAAPDGVCEIIDESNGCDEDGRPGGGG